MSSNASQKVTFRIAKRHLLPDCSFPPAESGADTALRGGACARRGAGKLFTPRPLPRHHQAAAITPPRRSHLRRPCSPPCRRAETCAQCRAIHRRRGAYARPPSRPPALRRRRGGAARARPSWGKAGRSGARKGTSRAASDPQTGGRGRGNAFGKKQEGREGNTKKRATTLTATAPINQL